ncbi:hypothetical protein [Dyadobacter crusticola]|uniref:hypothetical protein n=1 Tax=Dyadobacter crusticola TaxID=292407 RepID=UPI00068EFDD2|nr:hypothetical protein [Dyadobacter crusticola]
MNTFTHIAQNRSLKNWALMLFVSLSLAACDGDKAEPVDTYQYYPLEVGRYAIYDVREEIYSTGQANPVIKNWQEKDQIERVSTNAEGISTYTYSRSTRNKAGEYWTKVKEFAVQKFPDKILTNIDNQTFFSMAFPIDMRMSWNGNIYNNLDAEDYHYEDLGQSAKIGDQTFNNVLNVVERNDSSIINRYIGIKQYGLGVGLISDLQTSFEFCQDDACIGSGKIDSGTRKTRKIVEFGGE